MSSPSSKREYDRLPPRRRLTRAALRPGPCRSRQADAVLGEGVAEWRGAGGRRRRAEEGDRGRQVLELGAGLGRHRQRSAGVRRPPRHGRLLGTAARALPPDHAGQHRPRAARRRASTGGTPPRSSRCCRAASVRERVSVDHRGDLLYEGRDAEPLLNVIEQMLTADGSLWLAEPVRRTAQRFLDSARRSGWDIESRQVKAHWPDATDGPVNLHFLRRSRRAGPDVRRPWRHSHMTT